MRKLIVLILTSFSLLSCGYSVEDSTEYKRLQAALRESDENLVKAKRESSEIDKEFIIKEYLRKEDSLNNVGILKKVQQMDYSPIGLDSFNVVTNSTRRHFKFLFGKNHGGIYGMGFSLYELKKLYDELPYLVAKIKSPKNLKIYYESNREILKKMTLISPAMQETYRDAKVMAEYFEGLENSKTNSFKNYFEKNNGQPIIYSITHGDSSYYASHPEVVELISEFGGNSQVAYEHYKAWLFVKRRRADFGDAWCKAVAEILKDFGEV